MENKNDHKLLIKIKDEKKFSSLLEKFLNKKE